MPTIYLRGGRHEAARLIRSVVAAIGGAPNEHAKAAEYVHTMVGWSALASVKENFEKKADGQAGTDGLPPWKPLSREYLAYQRRFGPGEKAALKRAAGLGKGNRHRGLLTAAQDRRWRQIFSQAVRAFAVKTPWDAAQHAAAVAWTVLKAEGAKTMLEVYGTRKVQMLRDTGILFNSISPGTMTGNVDSPGYEKPTGDGGEQQVFDLITAGVIVGTNVPYAKHHQGDRKNPSNSRPFLGKGEIPAKWLEQILADGHTAVSTVIQHVLVQRAN